MSTVALEKVAIWRGWSRQAWRDRIDPYYTEEFLVSFNCVYLFFLISKWAPKFVKLKVYDL
jgi:hypothetical protein